MSSVGKVPHESTSNSIKQQQASWGKGSRLIFKVSIPEAMNHGGETTTG